MSAILLAAPGRRDLHRHREGARAFLPEDDDHVVDTRVWLGLCELGRGHPGVGLRADQVPPHEADGPDEADDEGLDLLMTVLEGLNARLCDPHEPMTLVRACDLLAAHEDRRLGRPA